MNNLFKGKQYNHQIIIEAIGFYYHFSLSYRDCVKIMRKYSIDVNHTTIYRWHDSTERYCTICGKREISATHYQNSGGLIRTISK